VTGPLPPRAPGGAQAEGAAHEWADWVGREERHGAFAARDLVAFLEASLDRPAPADGAALAPLRHWLWLFAPPATDTSRLDADGHPPRGPLVPTWPLPRRMWAGSIVHWLAPVKLHAPLIRHTSIASVEIKRGRSGTLGFMTLRHRWHSDGECAMDELQTVVYREAAPVVAPATAPQRPRSALPEAAAPRPGCWQVTRMPTEVLLFRYSALTFNSHRIHYDRDYATRVEGYPGLVVHGPLMATLMLDAFRDTHPDARPRSFTFRAVAPAFDGAPLSVGGEPAGDGRATLWVRGADGTAHVDGEVRFD